MKDNIFYSNSLLRFKVILILAAFYILIFLTACPKSPEAKIRITVNKTPISMEWNEDAGLWYMNPYVTITETAGAGVNFEYLKIEFISPAGNIYETQTMGFSGGRVDAFESVTNDIEIGTTNPYHDEVRFSISGTDDNGHNVKALIDVPLDYIR